MSRDGEVEDISFSAYVKKLLTMVGWSHWLRTAPGYSVVWSFLLLLLTMSSNYVPWFPKLLLCNVFVTQIANIMFSWSLLVLQLPRLLFCIDNTVRQWGRIAFTTVKHVRKSCSLLLKGSLIACDPGTLHLLNHTAKAYQLRLVRKIPYPFLRENFSSQYLGLSKRES